MFYMRATVDADVEIYLREAVQREGKSFKELINDVLRKALRPAHAKKSPRLLPPRSLGTPLCPDPLDLSDYADELEAKDYTEHYNRHKK